MTIKRINTFFLFEEPIFNVQNPGTSLLFFKFRVCRLFFKIRVEMWVSEILVSVETRV